MVIRNRSAVPLKWKRKRVDDKSKATAVQDRIFGRSMVDPLSPLGEEVGDIVVSLVVGGHVIAFSGSEFGLLLRAPHQNDS
jgi:hypothetical protein